MNEGWVCPVCRRGVAPDVKTCDHGAVYSAPVMHGYPSTIIPRPTWWPWSGAGCGGNTGATTGAPA